MLPVFSHSLSLCLLFPFLFPSWTLCNQCGSRVLTVWPLTLLFSLHQVFVVIQGALIVLTLPTSCMGMNRDVSRNVFALKIPVHTYALSFLFTSAQHVSTQLTVTPFYILLHNDMKSYDHYFLTIRASHNPTRPWASPAILPTLLDQDHTCQ